MTAPALRVRRATIEDLEALRPLWTSMHLPVAELEPRLTEFQIVEDAEGKIVGAIGFQLGSAHARLHSEGFTDFGLADAARGLLWSRVQTLCSNHGVLRLWTHEDTLFWRQAGFKLADAEDLKKLPESWSAEETPWLTMQLKDESAIHAVERELAMYMSAQKQQTERLTHRVRSLKTLATLVAVVIAIFVFGAAAYLILRQHTDVSHSDR